MTPRVVFRREAQIEFEQSAVWYQARRVGLGDEFVREVEDAIAQAAAAPERHPVVLRDIRRATARRFPFVVYFRVRDSTLIVLAVFHARRDPAIWRRRK